MTRCRRYDHEIPFRSNCAPPQDHETPRQGGAQSNSAGVSVFTPTPKTVMTTVIVGLDHCTVHFPSCVENRRT